LHTTSGGVGRLLPDHQLTSLKLEDTWNAIERTPVVILMS
jgi:hypothetical protein